MASNRYGVWLMKVLIDADVVLYLAVSRNKEETLEDGIKHFGGVVKDPKPPECIG